VTLCTTQLCGLAAPSTAYRSWTPGSASAPLAHVPFAAGVDAVLTQKRSAMARIGFNGWPLSPRDWSSG
jgi:hypothetical protein